jgi:uncharacterized membrane protein YfhO
VEKQTAKGARTAFLWTLALAAAVFVPFMIYNKGYMLFFGDFNVQQIPFYKLAHEAVRSGEIFWNWKTDLGANFIGSYSFYLLFSPFFWLTLPFPTAFVPYLMGPLLMLKTACAALTSFYYIRRFAKDERYAVIGAVLYAFSGFTVYNIFFNHFHEAIVFFPLLLISVEELGQNGRKGFFAAMVAFNCLVNYWFFIGEVVFVALYIFVRMATGGWEMTFGRFCQAVFESVLGLGLAMFLLLPSLMALSGNPRTTADNFLNGWSLWIYGWNQIQPAAFASIFFPPELPSQPNFFPDIGAKWSSMSAWLPLFSATGVIAYISAKKRDFIKRMLIISLFMALIPALNASFVLFNNSYYARWYYMPILLMCAATAIALEERETVDLMTGLRWTLFITVAIALAVGLSPVRKDGEWKLGLYEYQGRFILYVAVALSCLLLTAALVYCCRQSGSFHRMVMAALSVIAVTYSVIFIAMGKNTPTNDRWLIETALEGRYQLELPDEGFVRSDLYDSMDNLGMFWGLPNIQAFHSIVPVSIMDFYPKMGVKRDVSSKPSLDYYGLRTLLSVRWLFVPEAKGDSMLPYGYELYDNQLGYNIYENTFCLPMGFAYEYSFGEDVFKVLSSGQKSLFMLKAVYLSDEAMERNADILMPVREVNADSFSQENYQSDVLERATLAADSFVIDRFGFTADIDLPKEMLVLFSVPYEAGWTASVNGVPAQVERANLGFMAVRVPAGESAIRFTYMPPGLITGLYVTGGSLLVLILYLLLSRAMSRRGPQKPVRAAVAGTAPPHVPLPPPISPLPPAPGGGGLDYLSYLDTIDELPAPPAPSGGVPPKGPEYLYYLDGVEELAPPEEPSSQKPPLPGPAPDADNNRK